MSRLLIGDCRDSMRTLIAEGVKVQMCVTSPPYWGLRDYGVDGQLGLEGSIPEFIGNMVEVFDLVRELLADDGTLWLNMGDAYSSGGRGGNPGGDTSTLQGGKASQEASMVKRHPRRPPQSGVINGVWQRSGEDGGARIVAPGLAAKQMIGMPWRLAFALQDAGWWLRQDIIWHKPNPMPESIKDRCTKAHEYIFLMAKSERYYFDSDAIREPASANTHARVPAEWATGDDHSAKGHQTAKNHRKVAAPGQGIRANSSFEMVTSGAVLEDRNKRDVWTVASQPYTEAHFATYPPALIEPCILAGSKPGDIVFDPFFGSGTTGEVAQRLGREWIGCELNPEYGKLAERRTSGTIGLQLVNA